MEYTMRDGRAATRKDKVKLWVVRHQEVIAIAGVGTFVVVSGYFLVKADMKALARRAEEQNRLVSQLNDVVAELRTTESIIYPIDAA